ncbi:MAG: WD40 repeat domain-containing protein [Oligoflexales bacterium]|nr:WD40 repeat domain-containing protein [Oligoflexales bacterium]
MSRIDSIKEGGKGFEELSYVSFGDYIIDFAWSPDGTRIAAATVEGFVYLVHQQDSELSFERVGFHANGANSLSWRSDGAEFATAGQDGLVKIWDGQSGQELRTLEAGDPWVTKVAYNPRSKVLASSAGRHLRLWNEEGTQLYTSLDHDSTIADLAWNPDGSGIAAAAYNGLSIHVPGKQEKTRKYQWKGSSLALSWSPDSKYIASGEQDATVHFWHVKSGEDAQMWGFPTKVLELSWDRSGRWLATGGGSSIALWDCSGPGPSGRTPRQYDGHFNKITQLAFQPDGTYLVSSDANGFLFLWNPLVTEEVIEIFRLPSPASCLRWCRGGRLAVGQRDGTLVTLDLKNSSKDVKVDGSLEMTEENKEADHVQHRS